MSTVATAPTSWDEFVALPNPENGARLELPDEEVVCVPPPRATHTYVLGILTEWLTTKAQGRGRAANQFPYRPAANLQFWYTDVAYAPAEAWAALRTRSYPVYAPPLVIEVLSPWNSPAEIGRRRIAAFSGGTNEFRVVDLESRSIEVSRPGLASRVYGIGDSVPVSALPGVSFPVRLLFEE